MIEFDKDARKKIGKMMAAGRRKRGMTQLELAHALGYQHGQFICNFEKGRALPPRSVLSDLVSLDIIPEAKFKKLCLAIVKKDLDKSCRKAQ